MRHLTCLFIFFLAPYYLATARVVKQAFFPSFFSNTTSATICRFTTAPGMGTYSLKIKNRLPRQGTDPDGEILLELDVFSMKAWERYSELKQCSYSENAYNIHKIRVPVDGAEITLKEQPLGKDDTAETWFFVLKDCESDYKNKSRIGNIIYYELTIKNSDGSHLSEEENGVLSALLIALIPLAVFLVLQFKRFSDFYFNKKGIDFPLLMVASALLLEFLAVLFEFFHLNTYATFGQGFALLDYLNLGFAYMSHLVISVLFLLMAFGWTIRPLGEEKREAFIIAGVTIGVMLLTMGLSGKTASNDLHIFHDYQNWAGRIFLGVTIVMFIVFAVQVVNNHRQTDDVNVKDHYTKLGIFGSVYFLSLPFIVLFADLFLALYSRHKVITYGAIAVKSLALVGYAMTLASSKNNEFYPVYYKNRTIVSAGKLI